MRKYYYLGESITLTFTTDDVDIRSYEIKSTIQGYEVPITIVDSNKFLVQIKNIDTYHFKEGRADLLLSFSRGYETFIGKTTDIFFVDPNSGRSIESSSTDDLSLAVNIDNTSVNFKLSVGQAGKNSFELWKEIAGNENATFNDWLNWQKNIELINLSPVSNDEVIDNYILPSQLPNSDVLKGITVDMLAKYVGDKYKDQVHLVSTIYLPTIGNKDTIYIVGTCLEDTELYIYTGEYYKQITNNYHKIEIINGGEA